MMVGEREEATSTKVVFSKLIGLLVLFRVIHSKYMFSPLCLVPLSLIVARSQKSSLKSKFASTDLLQIRSLHNLSLTENFSFINITNTII